VAVTAGPCGSGDDHDDDDEEEEEEEDDEEDAGDAASSPVPGWSMRPVSLGSVDMAVSGGCSFQVRPSSTAPWLPKMWLKKRRGVWRSSGEVG
jgi:hypothetical protein